MAAKVTVSPAVANTPTAQILAQANAERHITDARGRTITLRKPGPLAQFRLVEAIGGEAAANKIYMAMTFPLLYVAAIDGDPVYPPASKAEVDALIVRLDHDGIDAVMTNVMAIFEGNKPADMSDEQWTEKRAEDARKSLKK